VGAVRGVLASMRYLLKCGKTGAVATSHGATHIGVATDHVIESFRNRLWPGYKTGEGVEPDLLSQFPLLEEALLAMGMVVWPMVEYEADDALASAAVAACADPRVDRVLICTPDKDLAQCVRGTHPPGQIVQMDRRKETIRDEAGVREKFGVPAASIPDYLALVGDSADGFPGLPGWGAKSAAIVLARYGHLEAIPKDFTQWSMKLASPRALAESLASGWEDALLFRDLATLRTGIPLFASVDELLWKGESATWPALSARLSSATVKVTPSGGRVRSVKAMP
jgi:5'-3' exonuclease